MDEGDEGDEVPSPPRTAWAILIDRDGLDLETMVERYGTVYRVPLPVEAPHHLLAPGQPCVLYRTDRSRTVGIWAIGEVVAPSLVLGEQDPWLPGEADLAPAGAPAPPRCYAEVELALLDKPLARERLAADATLASADLLSTSAPRALVALDASQLRAIEAFDFWLVEPDDEQRSRLDRMLAAEDSLLP